MEQLKQFNNLSSWREDDMQIKGGEVGTLFFHDTKPNMFLIQNPNDTFLKISISKIPTAHNYEFLVQPNSTDTLGKPTGTAYLYILNTGTLDISVKIFSIFEKFDMNILKNVTIQADGATFVSDGLVKGFESGVQLPSGTNTIGRVNIASESIGFLNEHLQSIENKISEGTEKTSDLLNETITSKNAIVSLSSFFSNNETNFTDLFNEAVETITNNAVSIDGDITIEGDSLLSETVENRVNYNSFSGRITALDYGDAYILFDKNNAYPKATISFSGYVGSQPYMGSLELWLQGLKQIQVNHPTTGALYGTITNVSTEINNFGYFVKVSKNIFDCLYSWVGTKDNIDISYLCNGVTPSDGHGYFVNLFKGSVKDFSGVLSNFKRRFSKILAYNESLNSVKKTFIIKNDLNTSSTLKVADCLKKIYNVSGDSLTVKVYFSESESCEYILSEGESIEDIDIDIFKIECSVPTDSTYTTNFKCLLGLY